MILSDHFETTPFVQVAQPCFCLCFGFSQMTMTRPLRLMILHFSQMGFTDGRTFIVIPSLSGSVFAAPGDPASGQIIGREFNGNFIPGIDPDEVHPHLSGDMRQDLVPVL